MQSDPVVYTCSSQLGRVKKIESPIETAQKYKEEMVREIITPELYRNKKSSQSARAIILAGGESSLLSPLTNICPKPILPLVNKTLLESQLRCLLQNGFRHVGIALPAQAAKQISDCFGDGNKLGLTLQYVVDHPPKGPAGCLKLFEDFIDDKPLLVVNGNVFLGPVDLDEFVKTHLDNKAMATLGMFKDPPGTDLLENIEMTRDGRIQGFQILHRSRDRRRHQRFDGIYMFDNEVLSLIDGDGYFDIKEQLIPEISQTGGSVFGSPIPGYHAPIRSTWDYYKVHHEILRLGIYDANGLDQIANRVWMGENTEVASSAYLLGPVLIGRNCTIEDDVQIIGPAVIGDDCRIGKRSLVRESVLWSNKTLSENSRTEYCITGPECHVSFDDMGMEYGGMKAPISQSYRVNTNQGQSESFCSNLQNWRKRLGRRFVKRTMDITASLFGLLACFPLFLIIALFIKFDSPGPIFFVQKRSGKEGREFNMRKFRTMVKNAEAKQTQLYDEKDVDGPMFKMQEDPRLTRVGKFLRQSSLDELPQFYNVLKGEMSLVGPRPLMMDEMRFSPSWRDLRLKVKPGITGLWQINGRSHASFHDWIRHDIHYVKNQSIYLDLEILAKTVRRVIKNVGAY